MSLTEIVPEDDTNFKVRLRWDISSTIPAQVESIRVMRLDAIIAPLLYAIFIPS